MVGAVLGGATVPSEVGVGGAGGVVAGTVVPGPTEVVVAGTVDPFPPVAASGMRNGPVTS
ncbi:MAG: hypothetical protein CL442_03045 [Acidimicrobiaceae bacterium]|nr:hypothetical protein [Acidimicrobiaceae bacterium]